MVAEGEIEFYKQELTVCCSDTANSWAQLQVIATRDYEEIWRIWMTEKTEENDRNQILNRARGLSILSDRRRPDLNGLPDHFKPDAHRHIEPYIPIVCYMFPHLSLPDLAHEQVIPRFIYHRAFHHWTDYQHADLYSTRSGQKHPYFHPYWNASRTDSISPPTGVKNLMVSFRKLGFDEIIRTRGRFPNPDDYFILERGPVGVPRGRDRLTKFSFSNALMIAKIQQRVYSFLVDVCRETLMAPKLTQGDSLVPSDPTIFKNQYNFDRMPDQTKRPPVPEKREDQRHRPGPDGPEPASLLAEARLHATFGPPGEIHWEPLRQLIDSNLIEAESNLVLLRGDPGIFVDKIRQERLARDLTGRAATLAPAREFEPSEEGSWRDAVKFGVGVAIKDFERWSFLKVEFEALSTTYERLKPTLANMDNSAPFWAAATELNTALFSFWYGALIFSEQVVGELNESMASSHHFKPYLQFRDQLDQPTILNKLEQRGEEERKRLYLKVLRLFNKEYRLNYGLSALVDDVERELQGNAGPGQAAKKKKKGKGKGKDTQTARYLTSEVLAVLGDLAVFAECLSQVENFQPWSTILLSDWNSEDPERDPKRKEVQKISQRFKELTTTNRPWKKVYQAGLPKPQRFDYPVDQERTKENVEKLRAAEDNLNNFWKHLLRQIGPKKQDAVSKRTLDLLEPDPKGTPPWEPPEAEAEPEAETDVKGKGKGKEKEIIPPARQPEQKAAGPPAATEIADVGTSAEAEGSTPQKTSPKRRRDDQPTATLPPKRRKTDSPKEGPHVADLSDKILVSSESLESLGYLMFVPGRKGRRSTLSWRDFRRMMADIGFAEERNGGSIWQFTPGEDLAKRIENPAKRGIWRVDEPHPKDKIPYVWSRLWGKKMARRYDWEFTSFAERPKEG